MITGASAGIGRELALLMARKGARLALLARRKPLLEELAQECLGGWVRGRNTHSRFPCISEREGVDGRGVGSLFSTNGLPE